MKLMALYGNNASMVNQNYSSNSLFPIQTTGGLNWADLSLEGIKYESSTTLTEDDGKITMRGYNSGDVNQSDAANKPAIRKLPQTRELQIKRMKELEEGLHLWGPSTDVLQTKTRDRVIEMKQLMEAIINNKHVLTEDETAVHEGKDAIKGQEDVTHENLKKLKKESPILFRNTIPIECSLTLDGISGIYYGNSFALEGLTSKYYDYGAPIVCFQIKDVAHQIDYNGWQTTISGIMRMVPEGAEVKKLLTDELVVNQDPYFDYLEEFSGETGLNADDWG
jgi:hypothetical protein